MSHCTAGSQPLLITQEPTPLGTLWGPAFSLCSCALEVFASSCECNKRESFLLVHLLVFCLLRLSFPQFIVKFLVWVDKSLQLSLVKVIQVCLFCSCQEDGLKAQWYIGSSLDFRIHNIIIASMFITGLLLCIFLDKI